MKRIEIIYMLLCLSLVVGCIKEYPPVMEDGTSAPSESVVITVDVANDGSQSRSAATYAAQEDLLGSAEYAIGKLRVYVFASNGELDMMEILDNPTFEHLAPQTFEVPKDTSKEFYFVANEPAVLTPELDAVTSAADLKDIDLTIAGALNDGFNGAATFSNSDFLIPMTAIYNLENAQSDISIYVGLDRCVARVDLYLQKSSKVASRKVELAASTTLSAQGATYNSKLFEAELTDGGAGQYVESAAAEHTLITSKLYRAFSFYTAEREYDALSTPITLTVDGLLEDGNSLSSMSIVVGGSKPLAEINRNHVYRIEGTYNGKEIVADHFTVMDWTDVELDAEIEGVLVAVDNEVAMDWLRNGNSFKSKSISFGSNKPIEFLLPVISGVVEDGKPGYAFEPFVFSNMSAGATYELTVIALENNYIDVTNWIESATVHFTSDRSGYIEFVYKATNVDITMQSYPIRIKSDNVIKQMNAVYDNGYIPASMLSPEWAKRAPSGVVFSKRGEAKHPVTTEEVFYRDMEGFYRGEYSDTADNISAYCARLGEGWYAPSYSDMEELAAMFKVLGVSYRFQNNGSESGTAITESRYWSSSASSELPGYFWSADFKSRDYMNEGLMERRAGSEKHFIRCIMDLK